MLCEVEGLPTPENKRMLKPPNKQTRPPHNVVYLDQCPAKKPTGLITGSQDHAEASLAIIGELKTLLEEGEHELALDFANISMSFLSEVKAEA